GKVEVAVGVVVAGELGQAGQHRRLRQGEVLHPPAEVGVGRRVHAVGERAIIYLVEVYLQDFLFRVLLRHAHGEYGLADLAGQGRLVPLGQEHAPHELLGDRGAAGGAFVGQVDVHGAGDALGVHAAVV